MISSTYRKWDKMSTRQLSGDFYGEIESFLFANLSASGSGFRQVVVKPFLLFDNGSDSPKMVLPIRETEAKWTVWVFLIEAPVVFDELNPQFNMVVDVEHS